MTRGSFFDRSGTAGLPLLPDASGVVAADYDGDGWLDLYFTQSSASNILMRNLGGFAFEDRSEAAGVSDGDHDSQGACFGDYDGDGWLDLYVCEGSGSNPLYRNQGDGTFVEVSAEAGVVEGSEWPSFQAVFWDYDLDGDLDLYLGHDKAWGWPFYRGNRLWRNDGDGTFTDVTEDSGTSASIGCMGLTVGDINQDQWPDIYMSNTTLDTDPYGNPLFVNNADGTFTQSNVQAGVVAECWGWGVLFWDFDNNGFEDLYVCNTNFGCGANQLFANYGEFPLSNIADSVNISGDLGMAIYGDSYTCARSDIDDDGDLDIVVVSVAQPVQLYINHEGELRNWLKIKLIGEGGNPFSVGARIDLQAAGVAAQRHLLAGEGFKSSSSFIKHVGLGDAVQADLVTITWPGGGLVSDIAAIPANRTVVLDEQSCADSPTWTWTAGTGNPSPGHGAYASAEDAELSWSGVPGAVYSVYFGSNSSPPLVTETTTTTYAPGQLDTDTTYYWRVDMRACVVTVGTNWSFTTQPDDPDTPDDPHAPTVVITDPLGQADLATDTPTITLSGVATYSQEPAAMLWYTDQGMGGPCVGLFDWNTGPIGLAVGPNLISVSATDRMNNVGFTQLIVTYTPIEPPSDPDSDETVDQDDSASDDSSASDSSGEPDENDSPETGDENPPSPQVDQEPLVSSGLADDTEEDDQNEALPSGRVVGIGSCGSLGTVACCFTLLGMSMLRPRLDRRSR